VLCEDIRGAEEAAAIAALIRDALDRPFALGGQQRHVSASIGCRIASGSSLDGDTLLRDADVAMYEAKAGGKDRAVTFSDAMRGRLVRRLELTGGLRRALEEDGLELHYQPQVDLLTHRLVGVEALARWTYPPLGPIGPDEFIPIAEESGLIEPLGAWVLRTACAQLAAWRAAPALAALTMTVNVSVHQCRPALPGRGARRARGVRTAARGALRGADRDRAHGGRRRLPRRARGGQGARRLRRDRREAKPVTRP
jgi:predicted signal transduction protein with EAL and GGDEF domain